MARRRIHKNMFRTIKCSKSCHLRIFLLLLTLSEVQNLDYDNALCNCEKSSHFNKPFVVLWNSPTEGCHVNFSVHIDLEMYGILTNENQTWDGDVITVFYNHQLGLYPSIDHQNRTINGGLPQLVNMTDHLAQVVKDIDEKIPNRNYNGIAMIDWELWRPVWETNFRQKLIYQIKSIELVEKEYNLQDRRKNHMKNSTLKHENRTKELERYEDDINKEAKERFESGARNLMEQTILLGRKIRPYALWGFYNFPACFGDVRKLFRCEEKNELWNNRLSWLYNSSTVLLPSIYLHNNNSKNKQYVQERLTSAFRFANNNGTRLPVFPYLRPLYLEKAKIFEMLTEDDLENSIGQSADVGCAGLILWGNHHDEKTSKTVCEKYNRYVHEKLGPYVTSLTEELDTCSREQCHSNGRCIEKKNMTKILRKVTCDKGGRTIFDLEKKDEQGKMNKSFLSSNKQSTRILKHRSGRNMAELHLTNQLSKTINTKYSSNNSTLLSLLNKTKENISNLAGSNVTRSKSIALQTQNVSSTSVETKIKNKTNGTKNVEKNSKEKPGYDKTLSTTTTAATTTEETAVRIPSVYIILITVTLGGALLMTVIYVAIYYAVNVRGKHEHSYENNYEEDNPFSLDDHDGIWWDEKLDQKEKLLKKNNK